MVMLRSQEEMNAAAPPGGGCPCLPTRVTARMSSSESLEGARASVKKGAAASGQRFWYNAMHKLRGGGHRPGAPGLGTYTGVLIPTCENMWGVLIFLRFFYIVGSAGVWQTFLIVFISFLCAMLTTMSLSAIATNGKIEQGGTYYLISRALGPKLGGAVGLLYYIGVSLLAVLECLGSVEMIVFTFPSLDFVSANRIIGAIILLVLGVLVFFGIKFVSKLGLVFFAIVIYTMLSFYMGLGKAPRGTHVPALTGLSWTTFKGNWSPGYPPGKSFSTAVSLFFPCFTGILSGADRATNLRRPEKSIPQGTLGAIVLSFCMYMSYMGLWAAVAQRDYLLGNTGGGDHAMLYVVREVAYPVAILTELGIIIASIAQAMQCIIVSPRLLQAIAADGVVPFLGPFSKFSKQGEPRRALMATTALCLVFAMIGSLDAVAPLVSICFLTCYSALNLSCLVLSAVNAPSWRPKWRYYHWSAALVGFLACAAMNFVIVWYWALVAMVFLIFVYIYIDFRQVEVNWGTGLGGLCLQIAVRGILSVGEEARYTVNWRPQLLCLSKPRSSWTNNGHADHEFLCFTSQLKKGQGLCVVTVILEGKVEEMVAQAAGEKIELENRMAEAKVTGFGRVLCANSYREGKSYAIQSSGLGSLEPNTVVLGWPTKWRDEGHQDNAEVLLETLTECRAVDKAVLLCMHLDRFPGKEDFQEGFIDVWWIVHDGGLLLLLAHLLQQHKIWRKCKLRVHTVAEKLDNSEVVKKNLERLLEAVRIKAEVQVLELDESCLAPYTFDYTIRVEEARAFAEEVANYRKAHEHHRGPHSPDASKRRAEIPKLGEKPKEKEKGLPTFQLSDIQGVQHLSSASRREKRLSMAGGSPNEGKGSPNHLDDVVLTTSRSQRSSSSHVVVPSFLPVSPPRSETSPSTSKRRPKIDELLVENADGSTSTVEPVITPRRKVKKKTQWADGGEDAQPGSTLEIVVDDGRFAHDSEDGSDEGEESDDDTSQHGSLLYPGSPGGNPAAPEDIPEPMRRTWESFSQSYSPKKLNDIIVEQSREAQLVLINLPDHYKGIEPHRYMEYCEELCEGLDRVLLVHGTGKELWGGQAHLGL
jgi:amino acid transporter